jgi:hypothetical protein
MPISLAPRDQLTLTVEKQGGVVSHSERRSRLPHTSCEDAIASIERLENSNELQRSLATAAN